jgi:hypothetical protein
MRAQRAKLARAVVAKTSWDKTVQQMDDIITQKLLATLPVTHSADVYTFDRDPAVAMNMSV